MKKIIYFILVFFTCHGMYGQGLEIGVYTEPQFTWISSDDGSVINAGTNFNLNTGIEFNYFFMPNYAFTFGLSLNNLGGQLDYREDAAFNQTDGGILDVPTGSTLKLKTQYIGTPLGLKLKTEEMGRNTFYVHLGLAPYINIRGTAVFEDAPESIENIKGGINLLSINYFAELGFEHRLAGNTALIAGFKWSSGFNDVSSNDQANNHHSSAGLHLGILF